MKKLIPALCMLLVAAALLGTSTYAWFSMNTTVSANGMSITAQTQGNLLISATGAEGTYSIDSINLAESSPKAFTLKPSSSVNGVDFFKADLNAARNDNYAVPTTSTTSAVSYTAGTNTDGNYLYSKMFYIKADGSNLSNLTASITGVNFGTESAASGELLKALKVGIAVTEKGTPATTGIIYSPFSGDLNYLGIAKATGTDETISTAGVTSALATGVKGTSGTTVNLASLTDGTEYQVLVTIWYEGQDANCTSAIASAYTLDGVTLGISFSAS